MEVIHRLLTGTLRTCCSPCSGTTTVLQCTPYIETLHTVNVGVRKALSCMLKLGLVV